MSIRFAQLPSGAGFSWRGHQYKKVSPLEGQDLESGDRRLVPRSAQVLPLDHLDAAPEQDLPSQRRSVDRAVHGCLGRLRRRLDDVLPALDPAQGAAIDSALQSAREDLLHQLEIVGRRDTVLQASPEKPDT